MRELYDWVPWFTELAKSIADCEPSDLAARAHRIPWKTDGSIVQLLNYGNDNIDPFSFIYTLAANCTKNQRVRLCESVSSEFALSTPPPEDSDDAFIFPQGYALNTLFHSKGDGNPNVLWRLFRSASQGAAFIDAEDFRDALNIKQVALHKLTQTLFLANPCEFLPLDDSTKKLLPNPNTRINSWADYQTALSNIRTLFPGCALYEANLVAYLRHSGTFSTVGLRVFQVSTNVNNDGEDKWNEFEAKNAVWTGGPGGGASWDAFKSGTEPSKRYPLREPEPGDLILVRTARHGRAIGITFRNGYVSEFSSEGRLHVVWINRLSTADLLSSRQSFGLSRAIQIKEKFFDNDAYRPTRTLLDRLGYGGKAPDAAKVVAPLNQVLYGPPGTGKTFDTTGLAVSIVDGTDMDSEHNSKRFNELRFDAKEDADPEEDTGNIAFVTFHQNFAYEDFVEGIRPVLDKADLRYELRDGIFKLIAKEAHSRPGERFVLIIDEINRGNIAKIFGELITLIEDSRRLGQPEETFATLPYSQESFAVPKNLYLIGTMNTADRSIQLLDTALRRRFKFRECMPNPKHRLIATDVNGVNCRELLQAINERIALLLDREHQIGHTYFLNVDSLDELASVFRESVFPLLQEYFFDDWAKIRAVLANNAFVEPAPQPPFPSPDLIDEDRKLYNRLPDKHEGWLSADNYQAIYSLKHDRTSDE